MIRIAARDDGELQEFTITEDSRTAALIWNVAGRNELSFFDLSTLRLTLGPRLPTEIIGGLTFSGDGRLLAMVMSGSAAPRDIWVMERNSGHLSQVTFSPHAGVDLATMIRPKLVRFPAYDGLELTGWLYRPARTNGPGPSVLSFHGGPDRIP